RLVDVDRLDLQLHVTHAQPAAGAGNRTRHDPAAVHPRSIARSEVFDDKGAIARGEPRVASRHGRIRDHRVAFTGSPEQDALRPHQDALFAITQSRQKTPDDHLLADPDPQRSAYTTRMRFRTAVPV